MQKELIFKLTDQGKKPRDPAIIAATFRIRKKSSYLEWIKQVKNMVAH